MEKTTPRCPTCKLGLINFGRLSAVQRFEDHLIQDHNIRCFECELNFSSQTHLRFHTRYQHDNPCVHCDSFCSDKCSETLGVSLSKSQENKEAQTERISSLEEEISHEVQKKIQQNVEFIDTLEAIAIIWWIEGSVTYHCQKHAHCSTYLQGEHQDFHLNQRRTKLMPGWHQRAKKQLWTSCQKRLKM